MVDGVCSRQLDGMGWDDEVGRIWAFEVGGCCCWWGLGWVGLGWVGCCCCGWVAEKKLVKKFVNHLLPAIFFHQVQNNNWSNCSTDIEWIDSNLSTICSLTSYQSRVGQREEWMKVILFDYIIFVCDWISNCGCDRGGQESIGVVSYWVVRE